VRRQAGVAAGARDTAAAAVEVLRAGGSAVDAVLAAGFAATVAEPALSSLGGGGFLLHAPADGEAVLVDFFVDVPGRGRPADAAAPVMTPITIRFPGAEQTFSAGWGSVAVPGCLAGYLHVSQHLGRLPLADVVEPARRLACEGAVLEASQASVLTLLRDIVTLTEDGRRLFAPEGRLLGAGDRLYNPDFADLLTRLAVGDVTDLTGVGDDLEQVMVSGGGAVTRDDLDTYTVVERAPLQLEFGGATVRSNPAPSFGAGLVLGALGALADEPPLDGSPAAYRRYVRQLVAMSDRHAAGAGANRPLAVRGTTHISVIDADGNVAGLTTSNGSCSGTFIPGTGIQLNNMMGESDLHPAGRDVASPGMRVGSMMMPTVLSGVDGTVSAVGTGGSERIPSAMLRVLTGLLDPREPLAAVVAAPRLHWDRTALQLEPGLPDDVVAALAAEQPVRLWKQRDMYFGGTHAVTRHPDGRVEAVADLRRGGAAYVVDL
jgi:gamma-glutamyltranspeptidase/glutathione hydrolase